MIFFVEYSQSSDSDETVIDTSVQSKNLICAIVHTHLTTALAMASSLQEFESRAKDAENKLKSLESQINSFLGQLSSAKQQKDDEKSEWEMICYVINSLYPPLCS